MTFVCAKELISFFFYQQHLHLFFSSVRRCNMVRAHTATNMIRNEGICKASRAEILRKARAVCTQCCNSDSTCNEFRRFSVSQRKGRRAFALLLIFARPGLIFSADIFHPDWVMRRIQVVAVQPLLCSVTEAHIDVSTTFKVSDLCHCMPAFSSSLNSC